MKRIAIACDQDQVSQHFGHCEKFVVYAVEGECVTPVETIVNENFAHGELPGILANEHGVSVIIAGRMGQGAYQLFEKQQVEVKTGVSGEAVVVANAYASGTLESKLVFCNHHHDGDHSCHH